jgi:hypothetical protein
MQQQLAIRAAQMPKDLSISFTGKSPSAHT